MVFGFVFENCVCGGDFPAMAIMAVVVAPLPSAAVASCSSASSAVLRTSATSHSAAPLRWRASSKEDAVSHGFSSCALRSSEIGIQELRRPHYAYDLAARGGGKRALFLTGKILRNSIYIIDYSADYTSKSVKFPTLR